VFRICGLTFVRNPRLTSSSKNTKGTKKKRKKYKDEEVKIAYNICNKD
jgi:hypothetical protein